MMRYVRTVMLLLAGLSFMIPLLSKPLFWQNIGRKTAGVEHTGSTRISTRICRTFPTIPNPASNPADNYLIANTQTAPPCGTSGNSPGRARFKTPCIATASTPHPDCTATYCLPSTINDTGWPVMPEFVGNCHRSLPFFASNAWNIRSLVPPVNTSPPAVASIGPQFMEVGYMCVQIFLPLSTSHA